MNLIIHIEDIYGPRNLEKTGTTNAIKENHNKKPDLPKIIVTILIV